MKTSHWIQHGRYELSCDGQVLVARLYGSWNLEAAEAFTADFRQQASGFDGDWAHLALLEEWNLGVPEIVPVIQALVEWSCEHGLRRAAQVYHPSMLKRLQLDDMVHENGGFIRRVFPSAADALNWLAQEGWPLDASHY